jgi:hypothetical protein
MSETTVLTPDRSSKAREQHSPRLGKYPGSLGRTSHRKIGSLTAQILSSGGEDLGESGHPAAANE